MWISQCCWTFHRSKHKHQLRGVLAFAVLLVPWPTRIRLRTERSSDLSDTWCIGNLEEVNWSVVIVEQFLKMNFFFQRSTSVTSLLLAHTGWPSTRSTCLQNVQSSLSWQSRPSVTAPRHEETTDWLEEFELIFLSDRKFIVERNKRCISNPIA